jgi:hypothetical protein
VVDHHGDVPVPPLVGDLVDAEAAQVREPVVQLVGVGPHPGHDRPTVRQAVRINSVTALFEHCTAGLATVSSKA